MVYGSGLLAIQHLTNKLHSPDGMAFTLQAHVAPSGDCGYHIRHKYSLEPNAEKVLEHLVHTDELPVN